MKNGLVSGVMVCAIACLAISTGCDRNKKQDDPPAREAGVDGNARLPAEVAPKAYRLALQIDPEQDTFSGSVAIDVSVASARDRIIMHSQDLTISRATLEKSGEENSALEVLAGENGGIALETGETIAAGDYTMRFEFTGPLDEVPTGLYRVKEKDRWYAFTQFEPLEARQTFPCFDEPRFKTPFTVEISSPEKFVVAANAPNRSADGKTKSKDNPGWVTHSFQVTRPLPTYLVAMTVGEFDVVEAPEGAIDGVPLRVLAPKGQGHLTGYALKKTPELLALLTDYFGQPYPFAKLDLVAVPNFSAGAMENVGLVTFRETLILLEEDRATPGSKYAMLSVTAHELAHMWFGNLVTPDWWNELWLNESFATWMASRTLEEFDPALEAQLRSLRSTSWIMGADSRAQTRAIRQPIEHGGDVYNAFDGITYGKGAAVLRMTEAWLGEEAFRDGVRAFMKENAYGTVTTPALMAALEASSKKPVYAMMKTFIDQPGAPLLQVEPLCAGSAAQIKVTQSRFLPAGSKAAQTGPWFVPMCIKYMRDGKVATECVELTESEQILPLPGTGCPDWVHPNADEAGYYRWSLPADRMLALATTHRDKLTLREQLGLMGNLDALVDAQVISPKSNYDVSMGLLQEENDHIVQEAAEVIAGMKHVAYREGKQKEYAALVRMLFKPHLLRLGLDPAAKESPVRARLRTFLLGMLGDEGKDVYVMSNAKSLVPAFLADPDSVDPYRARWAMTLAATEGDELMWEALVAAIDRADTPSARSAVVRALGYFRDPVLLERSLDLFLDDRIRSNEMWRLLGPSFGEDDLYASVTWPWFMKNYEAVVAKIGEKSAPRLAGVGSGFCDVEKKKEVEAFFGALEVKPEGLERNLSNALEAIDQCVIHTTYVTPAVVEFLDTHAASE